MTIEPFSAAHLLPVLILFGVIAALYFGFRSRSEETKRRLVFALMMLNVGQHFYKGLVWRHLWGEPFGVTNTAYNVCALLILASPFVLLVGTRSAREFLACTGTASGLLPIVYPAVFWGETLFQWEYLRSWTCHTLLAASSFLPILWREVDFHYRDIPKFGLWMLGALCCVLANNAAFYLVFGEATPETLYEALLKKNPFWVVAPGRAYPWMTELIRTFTFPFLLDGWNGRAIPILYYALPLYLAVTLISVVLGVVLDASSIYGDILRAAGKEPEGARMLPVSSCGRYRRSRGGDRCR